ncbi:hypothetical protein ACN42_g8854 [Penicillium freii]|uniref:Protein kinase domain-containing protein n=1 Tax=Penicillium freii TaxID=48697 RepID=A0A117NLV1_PENFR|nr:hypothetical protein ACN42_g8854 [Penicillium freii]
MIFQSSEDIAHAQILISDFGESFFDNEERNELHTPILLTAPEIFFHERASQASDVWTLACTLYEILGERPLFEGFMPDQDHVIAEMVSTLGHLPKRWWDSWRNKKDFFLEDGSWRLDTERCHAPYCRPLHERLRIMERGEDPMTCEFGPEEMTSLEKLLRAMLTYEPSGRATIRAALGYKICLACRQKAHRQRLCRRLLATATHRRREYKLLLRPS